MHRGASSGGLREAATRLRVSAYCERVREWSSRKAAGGIPESARESRAARAGRGWEQALGGWMRTVVLDGWVLLRLAPTGGCGSCDERGLHGRVDCACQNTTHRSVAWVTVSSLCEASPVSPTHPTARTSAAEGRVFAQVLAESRTPAVSTWAWRS